MVRLRQGKVNRVANDIPEQTMIGAKDADILLVSWGGTQGVVRTAAEEMIKDGMSVAHTHFNYIMPLPLNTREILEGHKKIVVCELNEGQFVNYLRAKFDDLTFSQYNKIQGLPFTVSEIVNHCKMVAKK